MALICSIIVSSKTVSLKTVQKLLCDCDILACVTFVYYKNTKPIQHTHEDNPVNTNTLYTTNYKRMA